MKKTKEFQITNKKDCLLSFAKNALAVRSAIAGLDVKYYTLDFRYF